jgi:chitinase
MRRALPFVIVLLAVLATPAAASAAPKLSIDDASVTEGNSGAVNLRFTIKLSEAVAVPVTVEYATADGTAKAPGDYATTSNTATFLPNQTSAGVDVPIVGDTTDEPDETFTVKLSNPAGGSATIDRGTATGTIVDDDPPPSLRVNDRTVNEGTTAPNTLNFTVSLSKASGKTVTVNYATSDVTAVAGSDYDAVAGSLTFDPGQTSKTVAVKTRPDTVSESSETFDLRLSAPVNATIADGRGVGRINDDDGSPQLRIADVRLPEGTNVLSQFAVPVTLSAVSGRSTTVKYSTANGTARAGVDYQGVAGTLTIPAGQTVGTILVPVFGDSIHEPDRYFEVRLSSASGASIADSRGRVTIVDDDVVNVAPRITSLRFVPRVLPRFGVATIRLVVSERALVRARVQRVLPRQFGGFRFVTVRRLVFVANPGLREVRFAARRLPAGRYRVVAVARDRTGLTSGQRRVAFRIHA